MGRQVKCVPLPRSGPLDNRRSYESVTFVNSEDWRKGGWLPKPSVPHVHINDSYYAYLIPEVHEWLVEQGIKYRVGYNKHVGMFVKVPEKWAVLVKLSIN